MAGDGPPPPPDKGKRKADDEGGKAGGAKRATGNDNEQADASTARTPTSTHAGNTARPRPTRYWTETLRGHSARMYLPPPQIPTEAAEGPRSATWFSQETFAPSTLPADPKRLKLFLPSRGDTTTQPTPAGKKKQKLNFSRRNTKVDDAPKQITRSLPIRMYPSEFLSLWESDYIS